MDLSQAINNKDVERVKKLLNEGADPNSRNPNCFPALYKAVTTSIEIVKLLIDAKADLNIKTFGGKNTPLMTAAENSGTNSSLETVKLLLDSKADINAKALSGFTALSFVAANSFTKGSLDTVKLLLDYKADTNVKGTTGITPLLLAAKNSNTKSSLDTVKLLIDYGANVFDKTNIGETISDLCPTEQCKDLVGSYIWKKLYSRDVETALKYSRQGTFPKDVWEIILLNRRQQLLCQNLSSDKNKEVLKWFAMELDIPVAEGTTKAQLCGMISRQIVYGKIYHNTESDMNRIKKQLIEIANKFNINTNRSIEEITKDIAKVMF